MTFTDSAIYFLNAASSTVKCSIFSIELLGWVGNVVVEIFVVDPDKVYNCNLANACVCVKQEMFVVVLKLFWEVNVKLKVVVKCLVVSRLLTPMLYLMELLSSKHNFSSLRPIWYIFI